MRCNWSSSMRSTLLLSTILQQSKICLVCRLNINLLNLMMILTLSYKLFVERSEMRHFDILSPDILRLHPSMISWYLAKMSFCAGNNQVLYITIHFFHNNYWPNMKVLHNDIVVNFLLSIYLWKLTIRNQSLWAFSN